MAFEINYVAKALLVLSILVAIQVAFELVRSLYRGIAQRQVWPVLRDRFLVRRTFIKVVLCGGLFVSVPFAAILNYFAQERIGLPAPDFSAVTLDGSTITLSEHRGKYVLLDFWATWCEPCVEDIPDVLALHQKFEEDLVIIGVSDDHDRQKVTEFVRQHGMSWIQVLDLLDNDSKLESMYDVSYRPRYVLIDREGNVTRAGMLSPKMLSKNGLERMWLEDVAFNLYRILPIAAADSTRPTSPKSVHLRITL